MTRSFLMSALVLALAVPLAACDSGGSSPPKTEGDAKPEEGGGDFLEQMDRGSLEIVHGARLEQSLAKAEIGSRW